MKKCLILVALAVIYTACSTIKYVPIATETNTEVRDSIIYRDSVIYVPKEVIKEIVPQLDTLKMQNSYSIATAYLDTTYNALRGTLESKENVVYRYIEREKIREVHDTTRIEIPIEVEKPVKYVPDIYKWALGVCIALILLLGLKIALKLAK